MAMTAGTTHVLATGANDGLHRAGIALRGVVAIALGACALYFRVYSTLLVGLFVAFAILDGIVRSGAGISQGPYRDREGNDTGK